jgi:alkylation response protein AidB-like acyl-CoA dehydrogenase
MEELDMVAFAAAELVQHDLTATARQMGKGFAGNATDADETDTFVAVNYPAMKEAGLIDAGVPAELGGRGAEVEQLCGMLRELARHCSSTALALSMHTHQVAIPAWRWRHQKATPVEPLLKRIAAERIVLLTSGGSDWIPGTGKAEKVEGGYRITARKIFASGAPIGDLLMTAAVLEEPGLPAQVLHFGVPMTSPHVKIVPTWKAHGMRATGSHDILIDGHVVPEAAVGLRRPAGEWHMIFHVTVMLAFPLIYAVYLGIAESGRDIAVSLARKRRLDRHITVLAGRMDTELRAAQLAHAAMVQCALRGEPGPATVNEIMIGRQLVARHAIAAMELAMETAGGAGFYRAQGLERRFRDIQGARYHPMQEGPQSEFAGAMALGLPTEKLF